MSFIIAAISPNQITIVGDTQLNVDDVPINETGIKVMPIDNHTLIGITGDYNTYFELLEKLNKIENINQLTFEEKIPYIKEYVDIPNRSNNLVIATLEGNIGKCTIMGNDYGYNNPIELISSGMAIRTLLPPGVSDNDCKQHIHSMLCIRDQLISCVEAISKISDTVNNKIVGFETIGNDIRMFTKNINYEDVTYRITF